MEKKNLQQIKVGLFVLIGLFLIMFSIFFVGEEKTFLERHYTLHAKFNDISGLRVGAPIFLAGVGVGKVEDIHFPSSLEEKDVTLELSVAHRFQDRIRQDSEAAIVTQGLLGDKVVLISVGSPAEAVLKNGATLKSRKGYGLENFAEKGGELIEQLTDLSKKMNTIVSDIQVKDGFLHSLIYDLKGKNIIPDIAAVSHDARDVAQQIRQGKGILHAMLYDPADPEFAKNLSKTVENFKASSQSIKESTAKIERGEGTIGGLINDPTVYYDLKTLLGKANRSKMIRSVVRYTLQQNEKETLK